MLYFWQNSGEWCQMTDFPVPSRCYLVVLCLPLCKSKQIFCHTIINIWRYKTTLNAHQYIYYITYLDNFVFKYLVGEDAYAHLTLISTWPIMSCCHNLQTISQYKKCVVFIQISHFTWGLNPKLYEYFK